MAGASLFWEKSTAGWFVVREKYCWLVADKPSEQGDGSEMGRPRRQRGDEVSSFFTDSLPRWILVFFILYYITLSILFWIKKIYISLTYERFVIFDQQLVQTFLWTLIHLYPKSI
jgi:hypothetical protein